MNKLRTNETKQQQQQTPFSLASCILVNGWLCSDWALCIQRGFQIIRWHLLIPIAEVSLCRTGVWREGRKKVLTAHLLFFRYSYFHWITQTEGAGRLRREGRESNPKEVHIVKRNNPGLTQNSKF